MTSSSTPETEDDAKRNNNNDYVQQTHKTLYSCLDLESFFLSINNYKLSLVLLLHSPKRLTLDWIASFFSPEISSVFGMTAFHSPLPPPAASFQNTISNLKTDLIWWEYFWAFLFCWSVFLLHVFVKTMQAGSLTSFHCQWTCKRGSALPPAKATENVLLFFRFVFCGGGGHYEGLCAVRTSLWRLFWILKEPPVLDNFRH